MEITSKFWNSGHYVNFKLKIGKYENVIDFLIKHDLFFLASIDINFDDVPLNLRGKGYSKNLLDYLSKNANNTPLIKLFIGYFITDIIKIEPIKYSFDSSDKWETMTFISAPVTPISAPITANVNGTSGTDGTSGINGIDGTSGINGIDGTNGTNGTSGIDGTNGTSGVDGTNGTSGIDGTNGTSGIDGTNGTSGIDGTNGTSGIDGISGEIITWTTGESKPVIEANTIIGELLEGDTHYITKSVDNDVAIINNINKQFPSYYTTKNTTLTDQPFIVKSQGNKFVCLDYDYYKLFRLNADLTLDDTFSNEINDISNDIYDFLVLNDNTILVTSYDTNNSISSMFKLDIDGNINQNFENTKIFNELLSCSSIVKTQSNGKIICCVYENSYIPKRYIGRFNVDGSIDNTFNIILLSDSTVFTILNDDSIVYKFYDQPNNRYLLKKCNSEGVEDAAYAANFIDSGYGVEHIMDLNESFTDGSMLFLERSFNNIIKINQDGTPNVEYSNNISTVNMYGNRGYANIILHNNKLVTISFLMSEIGLQPKTDIVVIAENGLIESSVRLDGIGIAIYESTNSYLITFYNYNGIYAYSQLYNSEFNPVFTTLVEKPHYALQKQLEYPIFTPNNYYIPAIINLQHEIALTRYVSGGEGTNFNYYNFNSETEEFDILLTSQSSNIVYQNSLLFKNTYSNDTINHELLTYDLQEIPGLSIYGVDLNSVIIGGGYNVPIGYSLSRMYVNDQNVITIVNNNTQTIEWFNETTGLLVSNWSWSGLTGATLTGSTDVCLYKLNDTKIALANLYNNDYSIIGILDLYTKNFINLINMNDYYYIVTKYLDDSTYSIRTNTTYAICIFPNQTEHSFDTNQFYPSCILESITEELVIGFNNGIEIYNNKTGSLTSTNLNAYITSYYFSSYYEYMFQNYDFYKLGDYYYLILNMLGGSSFAFKSADAITWEIIISNAYIGYY